MNRNGRIADSVTIKPGRTDPAADPDVIFITIMSGGTDIIDLIIDHPLAAAELTSNLWQVIRDVWGVEHPYETLIRMLPEPECEDGPRQRIENVLDLLDGS